MVHRAIHAGIAALLLAAPSSDAGAQMPGDSALVAPGARYRASGLHRLFFGSRHRDIWATPVRVPVLDLASFAGGLTPVSRGGGMQTASLRFRSADGQEYSFRSVDKNPAAVLDPDLRETFVADLVQDGISAAHPLAALIVAPILEAAGVLHVTPQLVVLPDSPVLGQFRAEFAGMLGMIEERPDEAEGALAGFHGASQVTGSTRLFERLDQSAAHRVDARAFLRARLIDLFLGDWDRHRDQWRWARFAGSDSTWKPIPRDRDQALSSYDGWLLQIAAYSLPQFVEFHSAYPDVTRLHWNARELDRRILTELPRAAWDSTGADLRHRLTDDVLRRAIARLPAALQGAHADWLFARLQARRDGLPAVATRLYLLLARDVDLTATDARDSVAVRSSAGGLEVSLYDRTTAARYVHRQFLDGETREIRLRLRGADDRVVLDGAGNSSIQLRLIGGTGDDTVTIVSPGVQARFYDHQGTNAVNGGGTLGFNRRPFTEWTWSEEDRGMPRDWGAWTVPVIWALYDTDLGLFAGGGFTRTTYGFRKTPYASRLRVRAGVATTPATGRFELLWRTYAENSRASFRLRLHASGLDVLRYYGLGNNTATGPEDDVFRAGQQRVLVEPGIGWEGRALSFSLGLTGGWARVTDNTGRFIGTIQDTLYGADNFVQAGVKGSIGLEAGDRRRGFGLRVAGRVYPKIFDVVDTWGRLDASAQTILSAGGGLDPTLVLRGGGARVWGRFPWFDAAFIGGTGTVRGWDRDRFAGDASLHGSAELRLTLGRAKLLLPGDLGVFGYVDGGRVWLNGASPGGLHTAGGGGLWFAPLDPANAVSVSLARSDEGNRFYITAGFAY